MIDGSIIRNRYATIRVKSIVSIDIEIEKDVACVCFMMIILRVFYSVCAKYLENLPQTVVV